MPQMSPLKWVFFFFFFSMLLMFLCIFISYFFFYDKQFKFVNYNVVDNYKFMW